MKNIVHLCDCIDYMKDIPDKFYELAIVDPPYGIDVTNQSQGRGGGVAKKIEYKNNNFDKEIPNERYFNEVMRVSTNQIIWGGNYFISLLSNTPCFIVWDKENGLSDFADCELAWSSFNTSVRIFRYKWAGMLQGNMKNKEHRIHPTQKPVALYKWLLTNYAKPGDKIFDSHVGSGSIRIACHDLGFDFEGCELDGDYWKAQEERYQLHCKQAELFQFEGGHIST